MFTRYENGAEVNIETVKRWDAGAETDASAAYTVKSSAEEEVWSAVKYLRVTRNTLTATYNVDLTQSRTNGFSLSCPFSTGYLEVTVTGTFVNPTITYHYNGGMYYYDDTGSYGKVAGRIRAFAVNTSGTTSNGTRYSLGDTEGNITDGDASYTFSGTFTTIGIQIQSYSCGLSEFSGNSWMSCTQIKIDGVDYTLHPDDVI